MFVCFFVSSLLQTITNLFTFFNLVYISIINHFKCTIMLQQYPISVQSVPSLFIVIHLYKTNLIIYRSSSFPPVADFESNDAEKKLVLPRRDPVKFIEAREQRVRERYVGLAEARALREEVKQCYYREGVNHYQNCREIVQTYLTKIAQHDFGSSASAKGF